MPKKGGGRRLKAAQRLKIQAAQGMGLYTSRALVDANLNCQMLLKTCACLGSLGYPC
jgi:hypothetical protein